MSEQILPVQNAAAERGHPSMGAHFAIARVDHWVKNVFVLPGILVALSLDHLALQFSLLWTAALGLLCACLVASSNYVINEVLDAPYDRSHPTKCRRPVPSGRVNIPLAYVEWLILAAVGIGLSLFVSRAFAMTMLVLWIMGCVYNIPPLRSKDVPFVDVLSEAINNPLRMLAGWYIVNPPNIPPLSLLISYWMVGCYFMALKRFAEFRQIAGEGLAAHYRRSFAFYNEENLMVSIMFYGATAMLFFGAFIMRYRLELILTFPLVALVMAAYLAISYKDDSAAQAPEKLYREPRLMAAVISCAIAMGVLLFVDIPLLHRIFAPTAPVQGAREITR